jgi:hypothetical protein
MVTQNTFRGMNQDISKTKLENTKYLDALDLRLSTTEGQSTYSLNNIRGNKLLFNIPNTRNVYKISVNLTAPYSSGTLTINGQISSGSFSPSSTSTGQDLYNFIANDVSLTTFRQSYNIAKGKNYIIIYSTNFNTNPSFSGTGLTITTTVPAENNLVPIGFTLIRNDIYIYTTPNTSLNPGESDPSSTGQIFKLNYNEVLYTSSLELIYNNYLNFSTYNNIATTANIGNYENENIQRGYWTDFYNPLRSANFKDPDLMALEPFLLNLSPPVQFNIPILKNIGTGGNLKVGSYQLCYRLKNTNSSLTNYSELSNLVFICKGEESLNTGGANFKEYIGADKNTITNKSITWEIKDIDLNFNRIEFVIIFRDSINGSSQIYKIADEPTNKDMSITYTGNEEISIIDLNVFNALSSAFTHCKTMVSKDNILFVGNTKNKYSDINYDSRAYSFPITSTSFSITEGVSTNIYNNTNWNTISEVSDAINPNFVTQKYQFNSSILGGSGPNINYKFGTIAVKADSTINIAASSTGSDYRHTNPEYNNTFFDLNVKDINNLNNQNYPTNTINSEIKYAYYNGLFKDYERGEYYRFSITFYDKQKNPLFTKWIADIKIPDYNDNNSNALYEDLTSAPITDFRLSFTANKTGIVEAFTNHIFIEFDVNIPDNITNIVSGYSISRVERTQDNKTILGTGILNQVVSDGGALFLPDAQVFENGCPTTHIGYPFLNINVDGGGPADALNNKVLFDCPEFLLNNYNGYLSGDQINIVSRLTISNSIRSTILGTGTEPYKMYKYYDADAIYSNNLFVINEAGTVDFGSTFQFTGWTYYNFTRTTQNTSDSLGSKSLAVGLSSNIPFNSTYGCTEANGKKLLAQYKRVVSNQYGGNTYTQRSNNEYINCSHFRPIQEYITISGTIDTFKVFGGDIYTQIYDNQKAIKNWEQTSRGEYISGSGCTPGTNLNKISITQFFPCTSSHNTGLRHGDYINRNLKDDDGSGASGFETHNYNLVYSIENNFKKYFPKPSEFQLSEEFDNRIYYSDIKINGEFIDSWGLFKTNNYYDVDTIYGPINGLINLNNTTLCFQEKALSNLSINPLVTTIDESGSQVILGAGRTIQKHNYITNNIGTRHQNSIIKSNKGIYWIDTHNKKMYSISNNIETVSEIQGMSSFFNNYLRGYVTTVDKPIYHDDEKRLGILGYFDYRYNEVVYTIHDYYTYVENGGDISIKKSVTICYNELFQVYTSRYNYTPYFYLWDSRFFASTNLNSYNSSSPSAIQSLWIHDKNSEYGRFYNTYKDFYIKFLVNPKPQVHKIYDNLLIYSEMWNYDNNNIGTEVGSGLTPIHESISKIRIFNDYQDTGIILLNTLSKLRRVHRYFKTTIFRDTLTNNYTSKFFSRIRDFYATVEMWYINNNNRKFILHDVITEYRENQLINER